MKTVNEFREFLGETMRQVRDGITSVEQAKAVAGLASEINTSVRNEIELARATDGDFKGTGFIDVNPEPPRPRLANRG